MWGVMRSALSDTHIILYVIYIYVVFYIIFRQQSKNKVKYKSINRSVGYEMKVPEVDFPWE